MMKQLLAQLLKQALEQLSRDEFATLASVDHIHVDRAKEAQHGDYATNVALMLAKRCALPPRQLAERIIQSMPEHPFVLRVEIAGPGFINFFVQRTEPDQILNTVLTQGLDYGTSDLGKNQRILLEYVSANPTGPLHVGHGRGAAFGASLANLLKAAGFNVTREYYVNDAGRQMNILAISVWVRYLELAGISIVFPCNAYQGAYVASIAEELFQKIGDQFVRPWPIVTMGLPKDEHEGGDKEIYIDALIDQAKLLLGEEGYRTFHQYALDFVLSDIKSDLSEFGVTYDNWFSEYSLLESGAIEKGILALQEAGHTYEQEGALWFKATAFGDEKDRVLVRANGQTTYFAADVAYHWNKYDRQFERVIDVFGADHHGYVPRIKAAVQALGHDEQALNVFLVQFAILYREGIRVQMSTRSGSFVTLRELREEVGTDAVRFFYVMRKPEQHLDFDLDLAKSESNDNPVYYVQYAHARICSVLRQADERGLEWNEALGLQHAQTLVEPQEEQLLDLVIRYPELINRAATAGEPHQIAYFLRELATGLHSYYNAVPLLCMNMEQRSARLCLVKAVKQVLYNGMHLLGVSAPESM